MPFAPVPFPGADRRRTWPCSSRAGPCSPCGSSSRSTCKTSCASRPSSPASASCPRPPPSPSAPRSARGSSPDPGPRLPLLTGVAHAAPSGLEWLSRAGPIGSYWASVFGGARSRHLRHGARHHPPRLRRHRRRGPDRGRPGLGGAQHEPPGGRVRGLAALATIAANRTHALLTQPVRVSGRAHQALALSSGFSRGLAGAAILAALGLIPACASPASPPGTRRGAGSAPVAEGVGAAGPWPTPWPPPSSPRAEDRRTPAPARRTYVRYHGGRGRARGLPVAKCRRRRRPAHALRRGGARRSARAASASTGASSSST